MFINDENATFSMVDDLVKRSIERWLSKINSAGAPAQDMFQAILIGAILSALATLPFALPFQASTHDPGLLALLGTFQLAIPCLLVVRLTRELPAPEISLPGQFEVIFGVTWAWLWAGEELSSNTLSGGLLVLGALIINELLLIIRQRKALKMVR